MTVFALSSGPGIAAASVLFHDCLAHDLFDRGLAVVNGHEAGLAEGAHAAFFRLDAEHLSAGVLDHQIAHLVVEGHDLVDAHPATIAGIVAMLTPATEVENAAGHIVSPKLKLHKLFFAGSVLGLALGADFADKALRDDSFQR